MEDLFNLNFVRCKISSHGDITESDENVRRASEIGYQLKSNLNTFGSHSVDLKSKKSSEGKQNKMLVHR